MIASQFAFFSIPSRSLLRRPRALRALAAVALAFSGATSWAGTVHVFTSDAAGFNTHSVWYDDGQEVTVVDAQFTPAHAEALLASIRSQTKSPVTRVVVTHPNPDKFNGLSVFHAQGIESIASAKTAAAVPGTDAYKRHFWVHVAKAFTDVTYPRAEAIKTTYSGQHRISLRSGETITLFELAHPGISSNQTVVRFDQTGDLAVGDLVHTRTHAWLKGGIVNGKPQPTLAGWKADLAELPRLGTGKVYGGRGTFVPVAQAVAEQTAYLDKADAVVSGYLKRLSHRTTELSDPARQGTHYQAISGRDGAGVSHVRHAGSGGLQRVRAGAAKACAVKNHPSVASHAETLTAGGCKALRAPATIGA